MNKLVIWRVSLNRDNDRFTSKFLNTVLDKNFSNIFGEEMKIEAEDLSLTWITRIQASIPTA